MKKSFTLFSTLILVFIFSILVIKIFEVKSISSINITNQYKYIQATNHLNFLEEYINSLDDLKTLDKIQIENKNYDIFALIKKVNAKYEVELIVKAVDFDVRLQKSIEVTK
ncbi:MAG: hypothetical protein C0625_04275 [Arcobacter sp.]|nr:MAG: hypothetical protein C0625_04275 [Arcobacter sp.]